MVRIISFDGNIGSGKSTFITNFKNYYENNITTFNEKICFLQEPVDLWNTITDLEGKTIIENFYSDPSRYAFAFQMMAYISRLTTIKNALKENFDIIITERCTNTDRNVFAKMLYEDEKINEVEYKIYNKWFDEFIDELPSIEYIYLRTEPEVAFDRIIKRNRLGETISKEYLTKCHNYHENWLNNENKYIVDCNIDIEENPEIVLNWMKTIYDHIKLCTITFYGNSRGEPGIGGSGFCIWNNNIKIYTGSELILNVVNTIYTEYYALYIALKKCQEMNIKNIIIKGTSDIITKLSNCNKCEYNIMEVNESDNLIVLYDAILNKIHTFSKYEFIKITNEENKDANLLAEQTISSCLFNKQQLHCS